MKRERPLFQVRRDEARGDRLILRYADRHQRLRAELARRSGVPEDDVPASLTIGYYRPAADGPVCFIPSSTALARAALALDLVRARIAEDLAIRLEEHAVEAAGGRRYLLNSAVVTAPGVYHYETVTPEVAIAWARRGPWESTIGYAETAAALSELLGEEVPVARKTIRMAPGDEALVFRIALPPGAPRIDPADKGRLGAVVERGQYELGLMRRMK